MHDTEVKSQIQGMVKRITALEFSDSSLFWHEAPESSPV